MVDYCPTCLGTGDLVWVIENQESNTEKTVTKPCYSCRGLGLVPKDLADDLVESAKPFSDE